MNDNSRKPRGGNSRGRGRHRDSRGHSRSRDYSSDSVSSNHHYKERGRGSSSNNPDIRKSMPMNQQESHFFQNCPPMMHQQRPMSNQPRPNMNQPRPNTHQPRPNSHQPRPNMHQHQPRPNMHQHQPRPNMHQHQPRPNMHQHQPRPNMHQHQPRPNKHQHQPRPNIHQPRPNMHQPRPNMHQPRPNMHQPGPNMHQPRPLMHQPGPNVSQFRPILMNQGQQNYHMHQQGPSNDAYPHHHYSSDAQSKTPLLNFPMSNYHDNAHFGRHSENYDPCRVSDGINYSPCDQFDTQTYCGDGSLSNYTGSEFGSHMSLNSHTSFDGNSSTSKKGTGSAKGQEQFKEITVKDLVLYLLPRIKCPVGQVFSHFKCKPKALYTIFSQNKKLMKIIKISGKDYVELSPKIKVCDDYLDAGCRNLDSCDNFHICSEFLQESCSAKKCDLGHNMKSSQNLKVWTLLHLEECSEANLLAIAKFALVERTLKVCQNYNNNSCTKAGKCSSLHLCQKYVRGGNCDPECKLNHNILSAQCIKVLKNFGIGTDDSHRDVLTKVRIELEKYAQEDDLKSESDLSNPSDSSSLLGKKESSTKVTKKSKSSGKKSSSVQFLSKFSSLCEQETAAEIIVKKLLGSPEYWSTSTKLAEVASISAEQLDQLITEYSSVFLHYKSESNTLVKLRPNVQLCLSYVSKGDCSDTSCPFLHICRSYLSGKCTNSSGEHEHNLASKHNSAVLKKFYLSNVQGKIVLSYLRVRFWLIAAPKLCLEYDFGRCNDKYCKKLHICYDRIFTGSDCFKKSCDLDHELFNEHNSNIIQHYNFGSLPKFEIWSVVSARVPVYPSKLRKFASAESLSNCSSVSNTSYGENSSYCSSPGISDSENSDVEDESSVVDSRCPLSDSEQRDVPDVKAKKKQRSSSRPSRYSKKPNKTVKSKGKFKGEKKLSDSKGHQPGKNDIKNKKPVKDHRIFCNKLFGSVLTEEICIESLEQKGECIADCSKLHSRIAHHWQLKFNGSWYNFAIPHNIDAENAYRKVSEDSVSLRQLVYGKTAAERSTFAIMNISDLLLKFDDMSLSSAGNGFSFPVRRLSTPSFAVNKSHYAMVYGWYFKDSKGQWVEYGKPDSTGVESHFCHKGSKEIEFDFLQNSGSMTLTTDNFTYQLDFTKMEQVNVQTNVNRPVRRRPKHALIEQLNPDDPFKLKRMSENDPTDHDSAVKDKESESEKTMEDSKYPPFWSNVKEDSCEVISVDLKSLEAKSLISRILLTMPSYKVTKINRLQNTFHWEAFDNQMEHTKRCTGEDHLNIQQLYYGTREHFVDQISDRNFEWRESFADSGRDYGRGAYFYNSAAVAYKFGKTLDQLTAPGEVVLSVAEVFVGSVCLGDPSMTRPPVDFSTRKLHNTTVDDLETPAIFVKYDKSEYCPLYFVWLKQ